MPISTPPRKTPIIALIFASILVASILTYFLTRPKTTTAGWYNDSWNYRNKVPVTNNTTVQTNVYVNMTIDTSNTSNFQGDCGDLRFTDYGGKLLQYFYSSGCTTSNTVVHVQMQTFPAGLQDLYYYYGNPSAPNGFVTTDFPTQATNYSVGTVGSQEIGQGPVLYWKFDEGQGTTAYDSSGHSRNGTLTNTPAWQTEDLCIFGKCLLFAAASSEYIDYATSIPTVKSVSFWVKPTSFTNYLMVLNGATGNATLTTNSSGIISAGAGFTSPTIYVNGVVSSQLVNNSWQYVTVTTATAITASNVMLGRVNTGYFSGFMDEFKLYPDALTAAQVKADFATRGSPKEVGAQFGDADLGKNLSSGLVGYWKMDESSGNVTDESGNAITMANINSATFTTGKFDRAASLTRTSSQYFVSATQTDTYTSQPAEASATDTYVYSADPTTNAGTSTILSIRGNTNYITNTLLKFDLSSIPANAIVTSSTLSLWHYSTADSSGTWTAYAIKSANSAWTESGATWNHAVASTTRWAGDSGSDGGSDAGCSVADTDYNGTAMGSVNLTNGDPANTQYDITLSASQIQTMLSANYGFVIRETTGSDAGNAQSSSTDVNPSYRPKLVVNYSLPSNVEVLDITGDLTVSAWIKPSSNTTGTQYDIAGKWDGSNTSYLLAQYASDLRMYIGSASNYASTSSLNLVTGTWYHIVATYQASTQTVKMFVNGAEQTVSVTGTIPSSIASNEGVFHVGAQNSTTTAANFFNGVIDEVRVYNRTLSSREAQEIYGWAPGPVLYYPFEDGSGTSTVDTSTNSQTGTLTSGPVWSQGKFGKGVRFDAYQDQYVVAADSSPLSLTSDLTVSGWINPTSVTASTIFGIAGKWDATNKSYLLTQYGDEIRMYIGSASNYATTNAANLSVNTWYHVSGVYNAAAQTVTIYVNGVSQAATTTGTIPSSISDDASRFFVGYDNTAGTTFTRRITVDADDGWEENDTSWYSSYDDSGSGNGIVSCFGHWTLGINDEDAALRFTNVTINQGTKIASAYITFTRVIDNTTSMTFKIVADEAADDAPAWSQASRPSSMNETEATAAWTTSWGSSGTEDTSDFASVIQEIIDRAGWTSGYDIRIAVKNNGTTGDSDGCFRDSLGDSNNSPLLTITTGGVGGFDGTLDDIKVYNYTRTQKQIVEDLNGGHPFGSSPVGSYVAYWNFDESYGTTANDKSLNANNLTLSSASWTTSGKINSAWNGDGAVYLSRTDDSDFDMGTDDFSTSFWFKSDNSGGSGTQYIVNRGSATIAGFAVYGNSSGNIVFGVDDDTSWGPDATVTSTTNLYDQTWHHIVATKTGTSRIDLYVDGRLDATTATGIPSGAISNDLTLYVGDRDGTNNGDEFIGDLDELKIYHGLLTADEVKIDYNQGKTTVLGALSTASDGTTASFASDRSYCPPGDTTSSCAPVGHWKFDENTGTSSNDSSGNGNAGTLGGGTAAYWPTWTSGKYGSGLNYDGTDDYTVVSDNNILDIPGDFTIESWFNADSLPSATRLRQIVTKTGDVDLDTSETNTNFAMGLDEGLAGTGQGINCAFEDDSGTNSNSAQVRITLTTGQWYHLACAFNDSDDLIVLYLNGVEVGRATTILTPSTNTKDLYFGVTNAAEPFSSEEYFDGKIDDIRIYNYTRTPAQIAWDYNRGAPIAHYKLDECSGSTAYDSGPKSDRSSSRYDGNITIGSTGTQNTTGSCTGNTTSAWKNGANGKYNASLNFDGTDDDVSMGNVTLVDGATEMSVCSWIKYAPESVTADGGIVGEYSGTPPGWLMWVDDVGAVFSRVNTVSFSVSPSVGTDGRVEGQDNIVTSGTWTHYCGTFKGATFIKLYKNGVLNSQNVSGTIVSTVDTTTEPLLLGKWGNGSYFQGQIDEVQIYNYALTDAQIKTLYNQNSAVQFAPITGPP